MPVPPPEHDLAADGVPRPASASVAGASSDLALGAARGGRPRGPRSPSPPGPRGPAAGPGRPGPRRPRGRSRSGAGRRSRRPAPRATPPPAAAATVASESTATVTRAPAATSAPSRVQSSTSLASSRSSPRPAAAMPSISRTVAQQKRPVAAPVTHGPGQRRRLERLDVGPQRRARAGGGHGGHIGLEGGGVDDEGRGPELLDTHRRGRYRSGPGRMSGPAGPPDPAGSGPDRRDRRTAASGQGTGRRGGRRPVPWLGGRSGWVAGPDRRGRTDDRVSWPGGRGGRRGAAG